MAKMSRSDTGMLVLRVALGLIFLLHGWMNVIEGRESFLREMLNMAGWSSPDAVIWFVTGVELLAGLALVLGLVTQWAALILVVEMAVAVALFHLRQGFFIVAVPNVPLAYGFEYHVALIAGLVCVWLTGPGGWALDATIAARRRRATAAPD
jgi:putative oxidoreductase